MKRYLFTLTLLALAAWPGQASAFTSELSVKGHTLQLNGKPFFPIISWAQCAEDVEKNLAVGVNLFMQSHCPDFDALGRAIGDRPAWIIAPYWVYAGQNATPETGKMVGYHQRDEPDLHHIRPEELPGVEPVEKAKRPVFLTLTSKFASEQTAIGPDIPKSSYPKYAEKAHVLGFDLYPLVQFCYAEKFGVNIEDVYNYHRELTALTDGPTYQWIELTKMEGYCGENPLSAQDVRAEIWLSLAGGATALAYFTHNWREGQGYNFEIAPEIVSEMGRSSREIKELESVLLAPRVPWNRVMSWPSNPVKVGGRLFNGRTWIIAVNGSRTETVKASFGIKDVGEGTATIWKTNRIVPVRNHALTDTFAPGEVKIYSLETRPETRKITKRRCTAKSGGCKKRR